MAIGNSVRWMLGVTSGVVVGASLAGMLRGQEAKPKGAEPPQIIEATPDQLKKALEGASGKDEVLIKLRDAQQPPKDDPATLQNRLEAILPKIESIKPLPLTQIPDDPPPHEGAMFDLPYTIQPPDILVVEVLEALAGRPISGERLVRPDGTITLGFYRDLHVAGLTCEQVKTKVILRLREYVTDEALGLIVEDLSGRPADAMKAQDPPPPPAQPVPPPAGPGQPEPKIDFPPIPESNPFDLPKSEPAKPKARQANQRQGRGSAAVRLARNPQAQAPGPLRAPAPTVRSGPLVINNPARPAIAEPPAPDDKQPPGAIHEQGLGGPVLLPSLPAASDRVFVDVASYNSAVFYLEGDFTNTGRYPCTGGETVLDAVQYGGGLASTADETTVRLVRPGRGGKPSRVYPIDLAAIRDRGVVTANLQLFPGDRLIVDRKAVVKSALQINGVLAPSSSVLSHLLSYAYTMRALGNIGEPFNSNSSTSIRVKVGGFNINLNLGPEGPAADPAKRQAVLKAWAEMISDDPKVREDVLKLVK